jgi:hypothetical protein
MTGSGAEITNEGVVKAIERLAVLRSEIEPILPTLKEQKNKVAAELAKYEKELSDAETAVREVALDYIQQTGDLDPHPALTFRRTTKLMYEKESIMYDLLTTELDELATEPDRLIKEEEMYKVLSSGGMGKYLKVAVSLDVRAFEKDFKDGKLTWAQVEEVSSPTIAIGKLGDIIIVKEIEDNGAN